MIVIGRTDKFTVFRLNNNNFFPPSEVKHVEGIWLGLIIILDFTKNYYQKVIYQERTKKKWNVSMHAPENIGV